jgi:hypothetical protein
MAENIVSGLFGISPDELNAQRRARLQAQAFQSAQLNPYQRAGYLTQVGAGQTAGGVAGMLGYQDPAVIEAQQRQEAVRGLDLNDPNAIREQARKLQESGNVKIGLQLQQLANERETEIAQNELRKAQAESMRRVPEKDVRQPQDKLVAVVGPAGTPVLVPQSQAAGMQPYYQPKSTGKTGGKEDNAPAAVASANVFLDKMSGYYDELDKLDAIPNENKSTTTNVIASAGASGAGQFVGQAGGAKAQSLRQKVSMSRPVLMGMIMKATGMSSKSIDSNQELKLWLSVVTNPQSTIQANKEAIGNLKDFIAANAGVAREQEAPKETPKEEEWVRVNGKLQRK